MQPPAAGSVPCRGLRSNAFLFVVPYPYDSLFSVGHKGDILGTVVVTVFNAVPLNVEAFTLQNAQICKKTKLE